MFNLPLGFDKPEDNPGFLLWQTTALWQRHIKKALEPYDVSHAQFMIMITLMWFEVYHYDTTQALIVHWSQLDNMTVSNSLTKLSGFHLIRRMEHATDTRAKAVVLTEKGKNLIRQLAPIIERIDQHFFVYSSLNEKQILI